MFNKIMRFLSNLGKDDTKVVQETFRIAAEDSFIYDITNGRGKGYNRNAIAKGHDKIGDFIHRGMQVQVRKIKTGV